MRRVSMQQLGPPCRQHHPPMEATSSRWLMPILALWARPYGLRVGWQMQASLWLEAHALADKQAVC